MGLQFKSLEEQVDLLISRGLVINDKEKAMKLLKRSNYYDVVNGYKEFLQPVIANSFADDTTFDEMYSIYMYDKNIKSIFFRKIVKAESLMRSYIAYIFCEKYQSTYNYLDSNNYRDSPIDVAQLISRLAAVIKKNQRYSNAISHYIKEYKEVPLWVLVNFMDFGLMEQFFNLMKDSEKNAVAKMIGEFMTEEYGIKYSILPEQLDTYLKNIRQVRNIVAHDNRLLSYHCPQNVAFNNDLFGAFGITSNNSRQSVYSVFITLKLFLSKGQFDNFCGAIKNRTKDLDRDLKNSESAVEINDVLSSIGFPIDWHVNSNVKNN